MLLLYLRKLVSIYLCFSFVEGIESFSKLGDSIYFEEMGRVPGLYVIQYISSSINWTSTEISLIQYIEDVVSWDNGLEVRITISRVRREVY